MKNKGEGSGKRLIYVDDPRTATPREQKQPKKGSNQKRMKPNRPTQKFDIWIIY
jgi:hypothetical protein